MQKKFALLIHLMLSLSICAQSQLDNVWVFGKGTPGGSIMDFSGDSVSVLGINSEMYHVSTNASICDSLGDLLFYSNGTYVADSEHQQVENSLLDFGELSGSFPYGNSISQGILVLPVPDIPNQYYLFYKARLGNFEPDWLTRFQYAVLILGEDGTVEIVEKDKLVAEIAYSEWGKLTACRHANGRDWWILVKHAKTNKYYNYLLTPSGLEDMGFQEVGMSSPYGHGQAVFSPNGERFATMSYAGDELALLEVYDFDRCSGELSNQVQHHYKVKDSTLVGGVAFSSDSRFLYLPAMYFLYQFDMEAADFVSTKELIAVFDGFENPAPNFFYMAQLAPDGKIYINSPNGTEWMHVINNPNMQGAACNFVQRGLELAAINNFSLPNYPYFNLGKLEGSPCDTIGVISTVETQRLNSLKVYPNPTSSHLTIEAPNKSTFSLIDTMGKIHLSESLLSGKNDIQINGLSPGIYFYEVKDGEMLMDSGRLIITR